MSISFEEMLAAFAEDDTNEFWEAGRYDQAITGLENSLRTAPARSKPAMQLKLSLCLRECGKPVEGSNLFSNTLKNLIEHPPTEELCSPIAEGLCPIGEKYISVDSICKAGWIFRTAAELFHRTNDDAVAIVGIVKCLANISSSNMNAYMYEAQKEQFLHDCVRSIHELIKSKDYFALFDHDPRRLASLYHDMAHSYSFIRKNTEEQHYYRSAVEALEKGYGKQASHLSHYGNLTHNLASSMMSNGQLKEAEELLRKASERQLAAQDWPSEERKQSCMETTRSLRETVAKRISALKNN
ncbi:uncharacterized protein LOC100181501 [Ciona intestinalis]